MRLSSKVAIVTGGARGLGAAVTRRLADEGASVVIADLLVREGIQLADRLGAKVGFFELDVAKKEQWHALLEYCETTFSCPTTLVNNAGVVNYDPLLELSESDFNLLFQVHMLGPLFGIQVLAPAMASKGGGCIVNISSTSGLQVMTSQAAYCSTKFGLTGLSKVAAKELAAKGIRVNTVHPGPINTAMRQESEDAEVIKRKKDFFMKLPMGRISEASEIAAMVAFLASDDASYSTGSAFIADGGLTAGIFGM